MESEGDFSLWAKLTVQTCVEALIPPAVCWNHQVLLLVVVPLVNSVFARFFSLGAAMIGNPPLEQVVIL